MSEVRQYIVNNLPEIRKLMITESQRNIIKFTSKHKEINSAILSKLFKISIENASTRLKGLWKSGYLIRSEVQSESGGIEYVYTTDLR